MEGKGTFFFPGHDGEGVGRDIVEGVYERADGQQFWEARAAGLFGGFLDDALPALYFGRACVL